MFAWFSARSRNATIFLLLTSSKRLVSLVIQTSIFSMFSPVLTIGRFDSAPSKFSLNCCDRKKWRLGP